jgi:hypothetical protein
VDAGDERARSGLLLEGYAGSTGFFALNLAYSGVAPDAPDPPSPALDRAAQDDPTPSTRLPFAGESALVAF